MPKGVIRGTEGGPLGVHRSLDVAVRVLKGDETVTAQQKAYAVETLDRWLQGARMWGRERYRKRKATLV